MENSLNEMIELLREIRDGIDKMNDRLEDIDSKLANVDGIHDLDDIHNVIDTMASDVTHELKMIEIKID